MTTLKKYLFTLILFIPILYGGIKEQPIRTENVEIKQEITLEREETASVIELEPRYKSESVFLSKIYEAEFPFQLLGLTWAQDLPEESSLHMEIRFRNEEGEWRDWQHIEEDQDGAQQGGSLYTYIITENSIAFQYRALFTTKDQSLTPKIADLKFEYVDGGEASYFSKLSRLVFSEKGTVIARNSWGADESLRLAKTSSSDSESDDKVEDETTFDDPDLEIVKTVEKDSSGKELLWPLEYPKKVKKIIVHHTATTSNLDDPEAAIRAIYYYHSVSRGWGDIGYNYIIDPDGNIYEGRYGGDGVVAGHARGYNTGSVGIALLGNYEDEELPGPMIKSLSKLLYEKAEEHNIDPDSSSEFHGDVMPNILGHRDVGSTACPGEFSYDYLPKLREIVGESLDVRKHTNSSSNYAFEESTDREMLTLDPNSKTSTTIKIKNTGTATWNSSTYLTSKADEDSKKILSFETAKMKESSVAPGQTASFTFDVKSGLYGGIASFDLSPVFNGTEKTLNYIDLAAFVEKPSLGFSVVSSDYDSLLKANQSGKVTLKLKNTGNIAWKNSGDSKVTLVSSGSSQLTGSKTLATLKESSVELGKTGTFEFNIKAPSSGGNYTLYYLPSMASSNANTKTTGTITVKVTSSTEDASVVDASTDTTFEAGEKKVLSITIMNNGNTTWTSDKFEVGVTHSGTMTISKPALTVKTLGSGKSAKINFSITAPTTKGDYSIYLRPRYNKSNLTKNAYVLKITVGSSSDAANTASYENPIRIKLTPDTEIDPILSSTSSFSVYDNKTLLKNFSTNSRVRVTENGEKFDVTSGSYKYTVSGPVVFVPASGGIMQITNLEQRPAWNTTLNDNMFRGSIEIQKDLIINELALEDYVKGGGEWSDSDPEEKVKAGVILYRTYAQYYRTEAEKFPGMDWHLDDDPNSSQKYLGYGYELRSPNVSKYVKETEDMFVTVKGKPIKTPYFSKSDGTKTKSAKEVWGWADTPWLVSVADTYCTGSTKFEGHGVGLSGCGATGMANAGFSYSEIIKYYFTGVEISKL